MAQREYIVCDCGGRLTRPLPTHCPHCKAKLAGERRAFPLGLAVQVISVLLMFALLAVVAWLLVQ